MARPAAARTIAAERPLGPDPMTVAVTISFASLPALRTKPLGSALPLEPSPHNRVERRYDFRQFNPPFKFFPNSAQDANGSEGRRTSQLVLPKGIASPKSRLVGAEYRVELYPSHIRFSDKGSVALGRPARRSFSRHSAYGSG